MKIVDIKDKDIKERDKLKQEIITFVNEIIDDKFYIVCIPKKGDDLYISYASKLSEMELLGLMECVKADILDNRVEDAE